MANMRMCPHCNAFVPVSEKTCNYCHEAMPARSAPARSTSSALGGVIPPGRFVTFLVLLLNLGMYAASIAMSSSGGGSALSGPDGQTLFELGAKHREAIFLGQYWRLITAGFLHGGLLHILMNSWALLDVGSQVEEIYGSRRLTVLYFAATVAGFVASTYWSAALSVGASAGLFGMLGAMIAVGVRERGAIGEAIKAHYLRWVVYMLLIGLLPGFQVDNAAHIGGLAAGFALGYIAMPSRFRAASADWVWTGGAAAAVLLTALSFVKMYLWLSAGLAGAS